MKTAKTQKEYKWGQEERKSTCKVDVSKDGQDLNGRPVNSLSEDHFKEP